MLNHALLVNKNNEKVFYVNENHVLVMVQSHVVVVDVSYVNETEDHLPTVSFNFPKNKHIDLSMVIKSFLIVQL